MQEKKRSEPFGMKMMWAVLVVPTRFIAGLVLGMLLRFEKPVHKLIGVGAVLAISAGAFLVLKKVIAAGIFGEPGFHKYWLGYVFYAIIPLPLYLGWLYAKKANGGHIQRRRRKKIIFACSMVRCRHKSDSTRSYLGHSFDSGRPLFLSNDERLMHTEVIGSTGTGKTDSVLLPMLGHDIQGGKGAIIIDGKGDRELYNQILCIVKHTGKEDKFLYFSLSDTEKSNTYNPFHRGNATELKDKLIGSMAWSEEFFRKMAEKAALSLLNALCERAEKKIQKWDKERKEGKSGAEVKRPGNEITFGKLHEYLTNITALKELADLSKANPQYHNDLVKMVNQFRDHDKFLSGLIADLFLFSRSKFSKLVEVAAPEIDLEDVYANDKIVYFQLDLQGYSDTAKRMGRMILQDIRNLSSFIQSKIPEAKRKFFPVFVDDASSFLDVNFIDFLNKSRASKLAVTLLHQSMGDLVFNRDTSFQQQLVENTNIKIILRQDDPQSVEKLVRIGGTRETLINTYQTEKGFEGMDLTGLGSVREGQAFRLDPDLIRQLKRGEAGLIVKNPDFKTDYVKLDYFGHNVAASVEREKKEPALEVPPSEDAQEAPKENPVPVPGEGDMSKVNEVLSKIKKAV